MAAPAGADSVPDQLSVPDDADKRGVPSSSEKLSFPDDAMGDPLTLFSELSTEQRQLIAVSREYYTEAGGELDEYGDVRMLRFLLWHDWRLERAKKQMRQTIAWRRKVGADAIRRGFREGSLTLTRMPKVFELIQCVSPSLNHRTSLRGDLLQASARAAGASSR